MDSEGACECDKCEECKDYMASPEGLDEESVKLIFGVLSGDDLSADGKPTLYTMNDLELCEIIDSKDENFGKYTLSIETVYDFAGDTQSEKCRNALDYLNTLLDKFTDYCVENNILTDFTPHISIAFPNNMGGVADYYFDTIAEAYGIFKMFVKGFEALAGKPW